MDIVVLKLGGAALTKKEQFEVVDEDGIENISNLLLSLYGNVHLILVHGAGSFGHHQAKRYNVRSGKSDPIGIADTRRSVTTLTNILVYCTILCRTPSMKLTHVDGQVCQTIEITIGCCLTISIVENPKRKSSAA